MNSLIASMLVIVGIPAIIVLPFMLWKMNMAMNQPEKYRRLREWEEEETARQKKILGGVAQVGLKAASRFFKR